MADITYALAGESHIAYRVLGGAGRVDIVMVAGALFPFELLAEDRVASRFVNGLAALGRLVVFDKRGVGLSDPMTDWSRPAREQWAEDLVAIVEATDLDSPLVVSWEVHGAARHAVAQRPDLFGAMALINPAPFTHRVRAWLNEGAGHLLPNRSVEADAFPTRINEEPFTAWLERSGRAGASPMTAARMWEHVLAPDDGLTPLGITTRTLVLHNRDCYFPETDVREVADAIAGSAFVQVPGGDIYPISGDVDPLISEIAEFVTGAPSALAPLRHLAAVLFTDLVGSTERAVDIGDTRWRDLLDLHDGAVQRAVREHSGRVVKYTGDGVLALLPSATSALEAAQSIRAALAQQGLQIRVGIHVGDVDMRGDDVSGLAINIAARIMSQAQADETLVSDSARVGTLGSGHRFEQIPTTQLKGIPGDWSIFTVR